jgi:3-hydroxyacyl-CoA dehydrogenase
METQMTNVASTTIDNGIGIITIDSQPVNALGADVRRGLFESFTAFAADDSVKAIVLICAGKTFFAGADITEFSKGFALPSLLDVFDLIEGSTKPVIAAIHGTALGGGLETALVCHYRVAVPSAKVGLPEVKLGLLPGGGGTQRLPRIIGPQLAMEAMVSGQQIPAPMAQMGGVIDELVDEADLRGGAIAFARKVLAENRPLVRVRDKQDKVDPFKGNTEIFEAFRTANARAMRGYKAPESIIKCVEAAVNLPFDEGMKRERDLFTALLMSTESAAQRHVFFAERQTTKIPDVPADTPTLPLTKVGVIGAGTMGGGITMNFLNAGIPVTLCEMNQAALDRGISVIRKNYENSAAKGKMSAADVEKRMALITPALGIELLNDEDLIIEAVFEEMGVKKDVFGTLDKIAKPGAILASNTSYLNIDEIAAATSRPESVMGLHFFSPANVMPLLEVVRGAKTTKELIATAMGLAKKIRKTPVLSRVGHGFIANRVMTVRSLCAVDLLLEGPTPAEIDKAIFDYGFAMGPFQMADLVGLDVIGRGSNERSINGDLVLLDRLGQKKNGGFYDYDEKRNPTPSPIAAKVIADFAAFKGVTPSGPQSDEEIVARLLYVVVNEGAKVLEEGIAIRASDVDMACILGYGWPVYTGGPMFWADTVGLPKIVAKLKELQAAHGAAFKPSALLEKMAAEGGRFSAA